MYNEFKNNFNFEIDMNCSTSEYVKAIKEQIKDDSLLKYGTWAFLGNGKVASKRYLYWTSINIEKIGANKPIPIIIQTGDGKYYVSESVTATRKSKGKTFIVISEHMVEKQYNEHLKEENKYNSLEEAYKSYVKLLQTDKYDAPPVEQVVSYPTEVVYSRTT